jgi:TRAP-type C4-dicarboxylate transport system permease large subunit
VLVGAIAFLRRRITMGKLLSACRDAVVMSTSVFIIVIGSLVYSGFLALNGFSDLIAQTIIDMHLGSFGLFLFLVLIYMILGMFMEVSSILALTIPLIMPIIATTGWNPIWFGVVVVALMEVAAVTPPVGLNLYAVKASVPDVALRKIYLGSVQFWMVNLLVILILYCFPEIALLLPNIQ